MDQSIIILNIGGILDANPLFEIVIKLNDIIIISPDEIIKKNILFLITFESLIGFST